MVNRFLQLEQHVFYITITYSRSLAFKVGELNYFSHLQNKDRCPWKEIVLYVHETTLTTESEPVKCYMNSRTAAFSKDSVSELFNLLQRTVEQTVKVFGTYVCNTDENALTIFYKKNEESKSNFAEFCVKRTNEMH